MDGDYKWAEYREDLFSPGATQSAGRMIDFVALKMGLETFEADAVDAYYQAPEHEEVVVESAPEYLERLTKAGRDTDIVWRLRRQLPGRRAASQRWVEHVSGILVNNLGFERCTTEPACYWSAARLVALELHKNDISWCSDSEWKANNSSEICHVRLNSREVTDVNWGNHLNILSDFAYQRQMRHENNRTQSIWNLLQINGD